MSDPLRIVLAGNPNTGKSSLFNALTGLKQKVANYPGITVEKSTGSFHLPDGRKVLLSDLPGAYSLFPRSLDEAIPLEVLINPDHPQHPHVVLYLADASNLRRNLVFLTQIIDLGLPVVLALNMVDQAKAKGLVIDPEALSTALQIPVVPINARRAKGIDALREAVAEGGKISSLEFFDNEHPAYALAPSYAELVGQQQEKVLAGKAISDSPIATKPYDAGRVKQEDLLYRHRRISRLLEAFDAEAKPTGFLKRQEWLDKILLHKFWGYAIFFAILLVVFQAIFSWAEKPMEWIESGIAWLDAGVEHIIPDGVLNDLITDGILAGLSGVLVFIPQIAFLFFFISIMEDTGYLARVAFLMDRTMRRFGLSGKSVIPLMSGTACAVPAILSARNIEDRQQRLVTILVTPFMTCSARLPIFILLVGMLVPDQEVWGFIHLQALVLMGLYLLGFLSAVAAAWVLSVVLKPKTKPYFILEFPVYRLPNWRNVLSNVWHKAGAFVKEAGKIIIAISIILWFLSTYGPADEMRAISDKYDHLEAQHPEQREELIKQRESEQLEASFAGKMGHVIEPVIRPLGYDWKIGIALITSFAAREVFVGTLATLYGVEGDESAFSDLKTRLQRDTFQETGKKVYTPASILSLLLFYVFAMQCMSTLAVTRKETNSWKWPALQFVFMTGIAYLTGLLAYQLG